MWPTERSNILFFILLIGTVITLGYFIVLKTQVQVGTVAGQNISHSPVTVSFFFGRGGQFKLYGYSSPLALIRMEAGNGFDETQANNVGYFEFANRYSPILPQEVCLTAQDQFGRLTSPICLPPFPNDEYVEIGPVILSPTLSFDKESYYIGDEVILSGQTIPNTNVNLSLFANTGKENANLFIKEVQAFSFPNLTTKSDSKGNFSISLPSTSAKTFRLFAQTDYDNQSSPKSLTLQFQILPLWMIIIKFFLFLWSLIKSRLLEIIILAQIISLTYYIIKRSFQPHAIVLRKHYDLLLQENKIVKKEI
jgi:hypothetical protein